MDLGSKLSLCGFLKQLHESSVWFFISVHHLSSSQRLLLSSNDLKDLQVDSKDDSILSFDQTVSRIIAKANQQLLFFKSIGKTCIYVTD